MSLQRPNDANISPFLVTGNSGANAIGTATIPADAITVDNATNSARQIVILSIDILAVNGTVTAIAAAATLTITTTGITNTPSWVFTNGFPAWTQVALLQRYYGSKEAGLVVPLISSGAQTAATIVVPALGAGVTAYWTISGIYI